MLRYLVRKYRQNLTQGQKYTGFRYKSILLKPNANVLKMKKETVFALFLSALFVVQISSAQRKRAKTAVTYGDVAPRTHVAQFEQDLDLKHSGRDSLKQKYSQHINTLKETIDTLDVSDKRKARLRAILKKNPFDEKLLKIIASTEQ